MLHHRIYGRFLITDQRNWAIQNVTSSSGWVLFLDADERATPAFLDAVARRLCESGDKVDGIYLCPKFMYQGTWLRRFMGFPNWHPRLVHRDRASYEGGVWENFAGKPRTVNVDEPYLHLVNSKGLANWVERHVPYAEDEAELMLSARAAESSSPPARLGPPKRLGSPGRRTRIPPCLTSGHRRWWQRLVLRTTATDLPAPHFGG